MPGQRHILLVAALALIASACQREDAKPTQRTKAVASSETRLWRIEVVQIGQPASQVELCADHAIEASFRRPTPSVAGRECVRVDAPVETATTYSVKCRTDDQLYRVGSSITGDPTSDFTVEMAVSRQDKKGPSFEQVRRYTQIGPCPAGWKIGDSAAPGQTQVVNTLSGEKRSVVK
ncbi:hypothetical protein LJR164_003454 [Phenylobacterium sp. LjRoot164]